MSTSETIKKIIAAMDNDGVRDIKDYCDRILGTTDGRKQTQYKKRGGRGGPKLKFVTKIDEDARNMYGIHGDWVDVKKLGDGGYPVGEVFAGYVVVDGDKKFVCGKTNVGGDVLGIPNADVLVFNDFNAMKEACESL